MAFLFEGPVGIKFHLVFHSVNTKLIQFKFNLYSMKTMFHNFFRELHYEVPFERSEIKVFG